MNFFGVVMPVAKLKCKYCNIYVPRKQVVRTPKGVFGTAECASSWALEDVAKRREKQFAKDKRLRVKKEKDARKADREHTKERKKALMSRTAWFKKLEALVNQYVLYVKEVGEPCCTCGATKTTIKYDAGHCFTVAARSDIRFELTNIHKQCSVRCNQHGSGMRLEYEKFIIKKYSQEHLDYLKEVKPDLKTQFPNWQDIEAEINRYRNLLRENGITPKR